MGGGSKDSFTSLEGYLVLSCHDFLVELSSESELAVLDQMVSRKCFHFSNGSNEWRWMFVEC